MRTRNIIFFISLVLIIYFGANIYLYIKGYTVFSEIIGSGTYFALFSAFSMSFVFGKILERKSSSVVIDVLNVIGGFWLSLMLYASLLLLISDISVIILRTTAVLTENNISSYRYNAYLLSLILAVIIIIAGFINSVLPHIIKYEISLTKKLGEIDKLRIAAISDIHLGSVIRHRSMRILSAKLNESKPDILLFLGDLVDGEINPVIRDDLLKSLKIPDTVKHVYSVAGNHEYIGGISKTIPYIESKGIKVLLDEVLTLPSGLQIIGRIDRDSARYTDRRRKTIEELLSKTDPANPIIVMDHQPMTKKEEYSGNFDLLLSGHTHNGQMWPFNYIVSSIYRFSYGHNKLGDQHHLISSGFGTWGPRVRIGSRSEILILDLKFGK